MADTVDTSTPVAAAAPAPHAQHAQHAQHAHHFVVATTRIKTPADLKLFEKSNTAKVLQRFVASIAQCVQGKSLTDPLPPSPAAEQVVALLDTINTWVDEIPPQAQSSRFGNLAFRDFYARLVEQAPLLLSKLALPPGAVAELAPYLHEGFGNNTRIDYGSGHELAFVALLCCLHQLKFFTDKDLAAVCLRVFARYLDVVRRVQRTYMLEPAGSHGVWGLDDHQFLPYLWGAAQLAGGSASVTPNDIPSKEAALAHGDDNLFFGCTRFIFQAKVGPFHEHSRYLYDMSAVPDWSKVSSGLTKMFKAEVLFKYPVIQHFLFGSILPLDGVSA